jgi:mercuric ion transport protein
VTDAQATVRTAAPGALRAPSFVERAAAPPGAGSAPTTLLATGGVVAALGALGAVTSCCLLPLALVSAGATGAWIGNLGALAPYQMPLAALAIGLVGSGFWTVYRRPKAICATGSACAQPRSGRMVKGALWTAAALIKLAIIYPFVQPWLLGA